MVSQKLREAPQPPPVIPQTKTDILEQTGLFIKQWSEQQCELIGRIRPEEASFANTICPLADIENSINIHKPILTLYETTSTHLDVGQASGEARKRLDEFRSERYKDRALFDLVHAVWLRGEDVDPESRRLVEMMHRDFVANGLNIVNISDRKRFHVIQSRIDQLAAEFQKNRTVDSGSIWFTFEQLAGTPEDVLSRLETGDGQNGGKVKICLDEYDHCDISVYVKDEATRKRFELAKSNKCVQNVQLLKEVVVLRAEAAMLLGYKSHAALRLESRMAKTPETVVAFLEDLRSRLAASGKEELRVLKELKRKDLEARGEPFDDRFYPWDYAFYNRQLTKKKYSVDMKKVKEYFEVQTTVHRMLKNFESLFSLRFQEIHSKDITWDDHVKVYSAWDEEDLGGEFLGYLYLDLLDREGKYSGIFNCTLEPGYTQDDSARHYPSTVLFCNFSKPTPTKPCLLSQFNLVMLFHELGHGIHNLVSKTKYSRFHGTETAVDFGEAPSQMLENWCWVPSFLKDLSQHYSYSSLGYLEMWKKVSKESQPPENMPDDIITGLIGSKYSGKPSFLLGQVLFALFDIRIHLHQDTEGIKNLDLTREYNEMIREIQMFNVPRDRADWSSPFVLTSHFMEEYDAGYYSYLFSQVYSTDMFYSAFKGDLMNKHEGRRYRRLVLEKGGSQDEMEILKEFLGRDPSIEAFYKDLALN
ncbi:metallopeptidase [Cadophora sp. DSE1049]|nr:metallopeptidase [Cadophora sp. DSE1049]